MNNHEQEKIDTAMQSSAQTLAAYYKTLRKGGFNRRQAFTLVVRMQNMMMEGVRNNGGNSSKA